MEDQVSTIEKVVANAGKPRRVKVIKPASFAPSRIISDIVELIHYRDLLWTLGMHRIRVRYKQSVLGIAWAILQPLAMMLIFTLVFTVITRVPSTSSLPYPVLVFPALMIWSYFSTSLTAATNGLVSHNQLVTKVYFPREILPLTYLFAGLFDFLIALPILLGMMVFYQVPITVNILYAFPILLIVTIFLASVSLLLSAVQVRFRDIGVALPLLLQIWMFASPVVYPLSAVPERFRDIYMLNPMAGTIENFRRIAVEGVAPDLTQLAISAVVAIIILPIAYLVFKHMEATVADII